MIQSKKGLQFLKLLHLASAVAVAGGFLCILALLLSKGGSGMAAAQDKAMLTIFNTAVTFGAMGLLATVLVYSLFTPWGFVKYRFLIGKWVLLAGIAAVAYLPLGSSLSGMASISDAGLQAGELSAQYAQNSATALYALLGELALLLAVLVLSVYKPFGKRETREFKHRKAVIAVLAAVAAIAVFVVERGNLRLMEMRNASIADVDISQLADGAYDGESTVGEYAYRVRVTVKDHKITGVENLLPRDSIYMTYATGVFPRIVEQQTPNVDAITGATTTSKAFMKAAENALSGK